MKNLNCYILAVIMAFFLSSCASLTANKKSEEDALRKRITTFMQAKIDENFKELYSYYDSSFRKSVSEEKFIKIPRKVKYKSYKIETLNILPSMNEAKVKVINDISFQGYDFKDAAKIQKWIKEKGQWFLKEKPPLAKNKTGLFDAGDKKID